MRIGIACGRRTRVPGVKFRCPGPTRRTRQRGFTSAVPLRERPTGGRGVSLHEARALTAHIPARQHHGGEPECRDTPGVNLRTAGLEPATTTRDGARPPGAFAWERGQPASSGSTSRQVVKERWRQGAGRAGLRQPGHAPAQEEEKQKGPEPCGSGPLGRVRGRALDAFLTRMVLSLTLVATLLVLGAREGGIGGHVRDRHRRCDAHERGPAPQGSVGVEVAKRGHDESR